MSGPTLASRALKTGAVEFVSCSWPHFREPVNQKFGTDQEKQLQPASDTTQQSDSWSVFPMATRQVLHLGTTSCNTSISSSLEHPSPFPSPLLTTFSE